MISHLEFMREVNCFFQDVVSVVNAKAKRYNGVQDDAFFTAKVIEHFGVCDAKTSIVARIIEKIARLSSIYRDGDGGDEALEDTLIDICGHVARLYVLEKIRGKEIEDKG